MRQFNERELERHDNNNLIIPYNFFPDEKQPTILIEMPFCNKNEEAVKLFLTQFNKFTCEKFDIRVIWKTKKLRQLFTLKERNSYPSCKIYEGICSFTRLIILEKQLGTLKHVGTNMKIQQKNRSQQDTYGTIQPTNLNGKSSALPLNIQITEKNLKRLGLH